MVLVPTAKIFSTHFFSSFSCNDRPFLSESGFLWRSCLLFVSSIWSSCGLKQAYNISPHNTILKLITFNKNFIPTWNLKRSCGPSNEYAIYACVRAWSIDCIAVAWHSSSRRFCTQVCFRNKNSCPGSKIEIDELIIIKIVFLTEKCI